MTLLGRFAAFFASANDGATPYPWQCALVDRVATTGRWPDISAPTGSGKSVVIDVHLFLVAEHAAGRLTARLPRRLVLVAPRRVLVDDQFDRAARLATRLTQAADRQDGSPLAAAGAALRRLRTAASDGQPAATLGVWRLRGGVLLDNGWRLEPAACQVICATPQMWGSRLLLRGYGATRVSRNLESGLLGQDAVAIIDEAHLHERLVHTARSVARGATGPLALQVVSMSATQPPGPGQIGLTDEDFTDPALERRVRALKAIELIEVEEWSRDAEAALVTRARTGHDHGTVGVFVNDVPTALNVAAALGEGGHTVELVCGRMRPADVSRLRRRRPGLLSPQGDAEVEFLVSTQSLEVGVDLDLPAMVTTIASAAALAQRAGRLNRSGSLRESTLAVVVPQKLGGKDDGALVGSGPYSLEELVDGRRWLARLGASISPDAVAASALPLPQLPTLPRLRAPDLETLAMTSDVQSADPDPELYLDVPQREIAEVGVIARRHLELDEDVVRAALTSCPPRPHEIATIRFGKALDRITDRVRDDAWVVRARDGEIAALRLAEAHPPLPGDTLVVPDGAPICTAGVVGIREGKGLAGGLDDVLSEAPPGTSQDQVVPLDAAEIDAIVTDDPVLGSRASRAALVDMLDALGSSEIAARLRRHRRLSEIELAWCGGAQATRGLLVVRDMRARAEQAPGIAAAEPVTVEDHQAAVERRMGALLDALMLEELEALAQPLLLAARVHDEGKRHPRFQRRMGAIDVMLAKPRPGHVPDRGDGWRHEQLSAGYAAHASSGDALVVVLVAGHHGRGRPLFDRGATDLLDGWAQCPETVQQWVVELFGARGRYELLRAVVQRRFGIHRLAWLEALLRCADWQISREGG